MKRVISIVLSLLMLLTLVPMSIMADEVKFSDDALKMLVKVPRPFLKLVLTGCVNWAKENNCTLITEKEMQIINDKRSKEKKK